MLEDNAVFEGMIHLMELSIVLGIAATIAFIFAMKKKRKDP